MEGVLTLIIALGVVFGIIWLLMSGAEKFGGISYSTRGNLSRDIKSNESYARISEYSLNKLKKENPALYAKASENLKRKRYANTYNNINSEIDKIKKNEPQWVEEKRKLQLEINLRNNKIKSDHLKQKHNKTMTPTIISGKEVANTIKGFLTGTAFSAFPKASFLISPAITIVLTEPI